MSLSIERYDTYSIATLDRPLETVEVLLTVDLHHTNDPTRQAAQLMYADGLLSGAGDLSREEFLDKVNTIGASIDISVSAGKVTCTLKSTATQFPKLMKLVELMLQAPAFKPSELKRIKATTINELHASKEDSKAIALGELQNIFYGQADRRYSYDADELIETAKGTSVRELKELHRTLFARPWHVSIASAAPGVKTLQQSLKRLKARTALTPTDSIHQPLPPAPALALKHIPSRQNVDLSIGIPLPITFVHPDFLPLHFGIAVLAKWGGFAGRLMSTVREKEGLTYSIYGRLEGFGGGEQGYFRIFTFFTPEKTRQGLDSTFREIIDWYENGITEAEFTTFRTILSTQQTMLQDSARRLLDDLHAYHCQGLTIEEMQEHKARLQTITRAEVNDVIKAYMDPAYFSVSGAGPVNAIQAELRQWHQDVA